MLTELEQKAKTIKDKYDQFMVKYATMTTAQKYKIHLEIVNRFNKVRTNQTTTYADWKGTDEQIIGRPF